MRRGYKNIVRILSGLTFAALLLYPQAIRANNSGGSGPVSPQVFTRGGFVYVVDHRRVVFLSMDTRSSHTLYSAADSAFNIVSAARSGDVIWASNAIGAVIAINMQTGTIEEFGRGRVDGGGRIDVDRRFVWVASGDTLYRMDQTSREWVSLPIPGSGGEVRGLISFNDQVHVVSANAVHVFTTASDDWAVVPHGDFVLAPGDFRRVGEAVYVTQERALYRYDPSKRLWNRWAIRERIRAADLTPGNLAVATEKRVYQFDTRSLALEPQPALPMLNGIRALVIHNGNAVCVTGGGLAMNAASPFGFNIVTYPDYINLGGDVFAFSLDGHIILYTGAGFVLYNHDRRLWSGVTVVNRSRERMDQYKWDENGAHINFTEDYQATLHGGAAIRQPPSAKFTEEDGLVTDLGVTGVNAALNLHTEDPVGRLLDIMIDNAATTVPPEKGFYYKGVEGDILNRASFGVQSSGLTASRVTPDVITEGASAVFSSGTKTAGRDRSFLEATAGSGYVLSKTEWRRFGYNSSGVYTLEGVGATQEIVPSTVRAYVDGIPLSGADFVYDQAARTVRLLRRDKTDPTSLIQISFAEKALPSDPTAFEPLPKINLGQYNFVEGAVSPRSWLSARAGVMTLEKNNRQLGPMALAGIPVELRAGANRSLLLYPEVAYDNISGAYSAAVSMGARENRVFGSYSGQWAGRDFDGIERPGFDYRNIRDEHDLNIGYDLRDNLRAGWRQVHRRVDGNDLSHFELSSSYTGNLLPDVEMSLSSRFMDDGPGNENRSHKETFSLRLSDPSSRYLSEVNRMHNVGYDLTWTEYQDNQGNLDRRGRVVYSALNVSPISELTIAGSGMYRLNPSGSRAREEINPLVNVYMRDLPRGFDISAMYTIYITGGLATGGDDVGMWRDFYGYFYPGEYAKSLEKFALYFGYSNGTESHAPPVESPLKYAVFTDSNTFFINTSAEGGLLYFPLENLLLSSLVSRYNDTHTEETYSTIERLKMWFEEGGSLEGVVNITKNTSLLYMNANALYEHRFQNGVLGGAGLFGTRNSENSEVNFYGGPQFVLSQTKDLSGFIRNIEHSHRLWVNIHAEEISKPTIDYVLYLRLKMPPDISLLAELGVNVARFRSANGSGGLFLHAGF